MRGTDGTNAAGATDPANARMAEAVRLSSVAGLSPPLVRAGRALLGWSRLDLAKAAGVSVSSLLRIEGRVPGAAGVAGARVREALEAAGLSIVRTGCGSVRIRMGVDGGAVEVEVGGEAPRGRA